MFFFKKNCHRVHDGGGEVVEKRNTVVNYVVALVFRR